MLKELEIDAHPIDYIRQELREGDTFAQYLLDLPLENGRVISYLPPEVHPMRAQDFKQSIFISTGIKAAGEATLKLQGFLTAYLGSNNRHYAVIETLGRVGDKWLTAANISYFTHELKIYSFLTHEDRDEQRILQTLKRARRYPFVCGMTQLSKDDHEIQAFQGIETSTLSMLAANTQHLVIGAFDDEAFLMWTKAPLAAGVR